jgi:type IV pilus assembly protein PilV
MAGADMRAYLSTQRGVGLVEVLVTMVLVAFGLLGLAAFQSKAQVGQIESYQRAQAAVLLQDMTARIAGNNAAAADYVTTAPLGTDSTVGTGCSALTDQAARDKCEWSATLMGAGELAGTKKVGAIQSARGCIQKVRSENVSTGVCIPAVYLVTVAWQGLHATKEPSQTCGSGQYGTDGYRRAISARVAVGLTGCY